MRKRIREAGPVPGGSRETHPLARILISPRPADSGELAGRGLLREPLVGLGSHTRRSLAPVRTGLGCGCGRWQRHGALRPAGREEVPRHPCSGKRRDHVGLADGVPSRDFANQRNR